MQEVTFSPSVEMACFTFVPEENEQSGFKTLLTSHVGAHFCFRIIIKRYPRSLGRLQKSQGKKKMVSSRRVMVGGCDRKMRGAKAAGRLVYPQRVANVFFLRTQ